MRTSCNIHPLIAVAVVALIASGCSQSKPTAGNPQPVLASTSTAPQLVPAKTALWPIYKSAVQWSPDAQVMRISQKDLPGFTNQAGKAALWEIAVASPSKRQYRVYTYAIANVLPDFHKGATAGRSQPWAGTTREATPIDVTVFNTDSDAAYQLSAGDAATWLANNKDKPLSSLELGSNYDLKSPVWYVSWGNKKAGYVALVNATSGSVYKSKKK